jgi:hypothetical protein
MPHKNKPFFLDRNPVQTDPIEKTSRPETFAFAFRIDFGSLQWSESTQHGGQQPGTESGLPAPYRVKRTAEQPITLADRALTARLNSFETHNFSGDLTAHSINLEIRDGDISLANGTVYVSTHDQARRAEIIINPEVEGRPPLDPTIVTGLYANLVRGLPKLARTSACTITHSEKLNRSEPGLEADNLEALLDAAGYKKIAGLPAQEGRYTVPDKMERSYNPE